MTWDSVFALEAGEEEMIVISASVNREIHLFIFFNVSTHSRLVLEGPEYLQALEDLESWKIQALKSLSRSPLIHNTAAYLKINM